MIVASWYILDLAFGAPNDALSEFHVVSTPTEIRAALEEVDPQQLLCDLAVWVVRAGQVVEIVDLRPFVRVHFGPLESRADEGPRFEAVLSAADEAGEDAQVSCVWEELAAALPALSTPLLAPGETGVIANTRKVQALVRAYGRASSVANYDEFTYGRHAE